MNPEAGMGRLSPSIPLGDMTTDDLKNLMTGAPGPAYTIGEPREKAMTGYQKAAAEAKAEAQISVTQDIAKKYGLPKEFVGKNLSANTLLNKTFLGAGGKKGAELRLKAMQYAKDDRDFDRAMRDGNLDDANDILEMYLRILKGEEEQPDAEKGKGKKPGTLPGLTIK
jgi:hypothetical protein